MDFEDSAGTRYQLTEVAEAPTPAKKPIWSWVVGGLALAGGLVWMASQTSMKPNPVSLEIDALILEARDPTTSWDRLWELFNDPEVEVRRALLANPNVCHTDDEGKLNTNLLEALTEEFPEEVAEHPLFVLHALIEPTEEFEEMVHNVVGRTKDVGLIEHLFRTWGSVDWDMRLSIARNPRTPLEILRFLGNEATESDYMVRHCVAENPSTPMDTLRLLGNEQTEPHGWVREEAQKALAKRGLA